MTHEVAGNSFVHGWHRITCECGLEFAFEMVRPGGDQCAGGWCNCQEAVRLHREARIAYKGAKRVACNGIALADILFVQPEGVEVKYHCAQCSWMGKRDEEARGRVT